MKRELKVGIFALVVLLAGWGVAKFLKGAEVFGNNYKYYAYYDQVGGIQTASAVTIHGVKVGSVSKVTLNSDPRKGVELELLINKNYAIPTDSKAAIFTDGIMGGKAVKIEYGSSTEYIANGGTIASQVNADIFEVAGSELSPMVEKMSAVMDNLTKTLEGINSLMAENTEGVTSIVKNVDGVTRSVNNMMLHEKDNLEVAMSSLSRFSKSLGDNADQIDGIIGNMSAFSSQLAEANLISELESVMANLNGVLEGGDGSIGKLLRDEELYDNLAEASENLSALLEDLKTNPKRYVHFSVFGNDPNKKEQKAADKAAKKAIKRQEKMNDKLSEHAEKLIKKE